MPNIDYEWCCEEWTKDRSDVMENYFNENVLRCFEVSKDIDTFSIALIRNVWCENQGLHDRSYAYVSNDSLPSEFDGGQKIPKRFRDELQKVVSKLNQSVED
jgi:hypothetical protein